jgi:ABC-type antimicrobial peptide transport system permease subunit
MIRFGFRLTLRGGREAAARLVVICGAVAVGVGLLVSTLAGISAVHHQNARYAWLETSAGAVNHRPVPGVTPVWWLLTADEFRGQQVGRVDVAQTGTHSPVPPGLTRLPSPGQYYASPKLAQYLRTLPPAELADRYPGRLVGTIGAAGLPSSDALIIVIGRTVPEVSALPRADEVASISMTPPDQCGGACYDIGLDADTIDLILAVVTAAILFPVLIFIGSATRLSAARREQRFAALRLVGATPRQIAAISAVESTIAASVGTVLGFGVFWLIRPAVASIPFTGAAFYTSDLSPTLRTVLAVALGVPLASAVAARLALRRVIVSPLGVTRRVTPTAPRAWRLLVPLLGLGELTYFAVNGAPARVSAQIMAYLTGALITMAGLVVAGPWLTLAGSRLLARRANRPAALVAARRLADNPQAGFRAISGLVVSLYVATAALAIIISLDLGRGGHDSNTEPARSTVVADVIDFGNRSLSTPLHQLPPGLEAQLRQTPGVDAVTGIHAPPGFDSGPGQLSTVVDCSEIQHAPALGSCTPGAVSAVIGDVGLGGGWSSFQGNVWAAASYTASQVAAMPLAGVAVTTDGTSAAVEQVRTTLETAMGGHFSEGSAPLTITEGYRQQNESRRAQGYQRLVDVVIITSLPIAGCTLAVSVVAGLNDRRRAFSLLRLTGAPLRTLRRIVVYEAAAPLLVSSALSIGIGFLTAVLFLRAQLGVGMRAPGPNYYLSVTGGLLASLAIIASTFPVLRRVTAPESARND